LKCAIDKADENLGYTTVKEIQYKVISKVLGDPYVSAVLPTEYPLGLGFIPESWLSLI